MELRNKATNIKRTPELNAQIEKKLLLPLRRLLGEKQSAVAVDIELAQITAHHRTGKIWKCEVTLTFPGTTRPLRVDVVEESLDHAINKAKGRITRIIKRLLDKQRTQTRGGARVLLRKKR